MKEGGGTLFMRNITQAGRHTFVGPGHAGILHDPSDGRYVFSFDFMAIDNGQSQYKTQAGRISPPTLCPLDPTRCPLDPTRCPLDHTLLLISHAAPRCPHLSLPSDPGEAAQLGRGWMAGGQLVQLCAGGSCGPQR